MQINYTSHSPCFLAWRVDKANGNVTIAARCERAATYWEGRARKDDVRALVYRMKAEFQDSGTMSHDSHMILKKNKGTKLGAIFTVGKDFLLCTSPKIWNTCQNVKLLPKAVKVNAHLSYFSLSGLWSIVYIVI